MRFARRFTATGVVVTLIDIAVVFVGVAATAWPLPLVDAIAVAIATCVSYALHRAISFAAEPARRWYRDLAHYLEKLDLYTTLAAEARFEARRRATRLLPLRVGWELVPVRTVGYE